MACKCSSHRNYVVHHAVQNVHFTESIPQIVLEVDNSNLDK